MLLEKFQKKYQSFHQCSYVEKLNLVKEMLAITKSYGQNFMELAQIFDEKNIPESYIDAVYENFLRAIINTSHEIEKDDISRFSSIAENISLHHTMEVLEKQNEQAEQKIIKFPE